MYVTAKELFDKLLEMNITNQTGQTIVEFMGVRLTLTDRSAMGDILQSWLGEWMTYNSIDYRVKVNTQAFPDFLLDAESDKDNLLEVKTFDYTRSPNFDVANFDAYRRSLVLEAYRLDADYLILGYTLENGILRVPNIWLKKIWEITAPSQRYPLKCQVKQDVIVNIRPNTWYSSRTTYKPFDTRLDFITALYQTIRLYDSKRVADNWLQAVKINYAEHTGQDL